MKTILLAAAASMVMAGAALANSNDMNPLDRFASTGKGFSATIPAFDTGSQAYPSTQGVGAGAVIVHAPHFNPALLHHPDTGSRQMPVGLR